MNFKIEVTPETFFKNGIDFFSQETQPSEIAASAHIHDTIEIIFVSSGSFVIYANEDKYEIFAGDMILLRSNVIHHIFAGGSPHNSYYVLKIRPNVIRELAPPSVSGMYLLNFAFNGSGAKSVWQKREFDAIHELVYGFECLKREFDNELAYSDIAVKLAAGSVLLGILRSCADSELEHLSESAGRTADCIYKAMSYINSNYMNDITVAEISEAVGLSYHYFSRSFKLITGKSFKEYLNITRINHAERLLLTTDKTVSTVCSECGYNDTSYFIKVYKSHKHILPGKVSTAKKEQ